jgi:hypothetical protein
MGFKEDVQKLAIQINEYKQFIFDEQTTKSSLIVPFIQVLGYDIFNPLEVKPEFTSDYGKKKGSKVDYAIFKDGNPIIFIEAKPVNSDLTNYSNQLEFYFNAIHEVKLGIITNGVEYRFFTDLNAPNVMDNTPFFTLSFDNLKNSDIGILTNFKKDNYDLEQLSKNAEELAYTLKLNESLKTLFINPSDKFIHFLIKNTDDMKVTSNVIERFRPIVKKSINNAILDMVSNGLLQQEMQINKAELKETPRESRTPKNKSDALSYEPVSEVSKIITTNEELASFQIVKSILENIGKDVKDLKYNDTVNYFSINNGTASKWFMRFVLNPERKLFAVKVSPEVAKTFLTGFVVESAPTHLGGGSKVTINSIEDLRKMQQLIAHSFDEVNPS